MKSVILMSILVLSVILFSLPSLAENPEDYIKEAETFRDAGELDKALEIYRKALEEYPENPEFLLQAGNIYMEKEMYEDAGGFYEKALALDPDNHDAYFSRGKLYTRLFEINKTAESLDRAFGDFETLLKIDPHYPGVHFFTGKIFFYWRDFEHASNEFKLETEITGLSAAYHYLGKVSFEQGDLIKALEYYQKTVEVDPAGVDFDITEFNSDVLTAQKAAGINTDVTQNATPPPDKPENNGSAESVDSSNIEAVLHYNDGAKYHSQGEFEKAKEEYLAAISLDPGYARAYFNLGLTLEAKGDLEGAIEAYTGAVAIKKDYENALFALGTALKKKSEKQGDTELLYTVIEHLSYYSTLVSPDSNKYKLAQDDLVEAHFRLGKYHKDRGEKEAALSHFQSCLDLMDEYDARRNTVKKQMEELGQ